MRAHARADARGEWLAAAEIEAGLFSSASPRRISDPYFDFRKIRRTALSV